MARLMDGPATPSKPPPPRRFGFGAVRAHESAMRFAALLFLLVTAAAEPAPAEPLHDAVDAYVLYQNDITDLLTADVTDEAEMNQALILAARHDPQRVASGRVAYGALTAAQSPAFVAGVRGRLRSAGRAPVIRQLRRDVAYARNRPPGSAEAIQLMLSSNAADTARLSAAGQRFEGLGASLASLTPHADSAARDVRHNNLRALAGVRRTVGANMSARVHPTVLSAAPTSDPNAFGGRRFWDALANRPSPTPPAFTWRETAAAPNTINRMLTLAGLYVTAATESESTRVSEMLSDPRTSDCLANEQMYLRQCTSVSASANEDAYCIARHGLYRPATCFALAQAP